MLRTPTRASSLDIAVAQIPFSQPVSRSTSYTDLNIGNSSDRNTVGHSNFDIPQQNTNNDSTKLASDTRSSDLINISSANSTATTVGTNMNPNQNSIPGLERNENVIPDRETLDQGPNNVNRISPNTVDPLILSLQQTILSTQDEFRRELGAIRRTISNISQTNTSPSAQAQTNASIGTSLNTCCSVKPIKFKDRNIKYDGTGRISDFLFKIETLRTRSNCTEEQLMDNFYMFLSGKAEDWLWLFIKQNPNARYPLLKYSITKQFGTLENDHDVVLKISLRKQGIRESYDDFHTAIVTMNSRLSEPFVETKLMLFNSELTSLEAFRQTARKAEKLLLDNRNQTPFNSHRQTSEIDLPEDNSLDNPQVEAVRMNNQRDYSRLTC